MEVKLIHVVTTILVACTFGHILGNLVGRYLNRKIGKIHKIKFVNYEGKPETVWLATKQHDLVDLYALAFQALNEDIKNRIDEIEANKAKD